ncbi:ATP-dependent helicase [Acidomonas methanolica]|uniref:DNA 3'-5' helicase n=2 Tax=Acidomonas methanolica TaxID=437 RepID=A0A023D642_ACIMT|nr:ATP-dependent helicase [Acidomonas methanolica]TCS24369.1 DNA helicase-2/ATP-dependent DNA helicase PcrA [Acidomonas methanolica]GAJ29622.1 DNA helicase II UvrD/Rep [Acidomonas methanolica NBRC 104435]GEK99951.1 DNA helicase [Acidomonas methanolica NBRC 104435]
MMVDLSTLNDRQLEAVRWNGGPLLVLAGPGSGKTTVLTKRIACLLEQSSSDHFRILALTFTNKAASEMRNRIEAFVPGSGNRVLLTTFHSFAGDLLRQHGHLIGLRPDFTILAQDGERIAVLDDAISRVTDVDVSQYSGERILPLIGRITENDVSPDVLQNVLTSLPEDRRDAIGLIYQQYRRCLIATNSLDFPSLIGEALKLVRDNPAVCKQVKRIYKYVCVDEFQDTNLSQYAFMKLLVGDNDRNLFVVADDDQIIYQWNGASPERLLGLRNDFGMSVVQLPANYRCPPAVIDLANNLIAHNVSRSTNKDRLLALKTGATDQAIRVFRFSDFDDELAWVASDIASKPEVEKARCVVLARTRKALEKAVEKLAAKGVSAYLAMRKDEFVSAPLRWLHAALRLANSPQDREQIQRLTKAFYILEGLQIDAAAVAANAQAFEGSSLRAFVDLALKHDNLSDATRTYIEHSLSPLIDRLDFRTFCKGSFPWFDLVQNIAPDMEGHFADYADERSTWHSLVDEIEQQFGATATTLNVLLQELNMRSKTPPPPKGAVPCFTIHASKGMEFGHVYLIAMVEDQLPSWAAVKKGPQSKEMQEERRNCFVAITRTEESLTMTFSDRMLGWNKARSRFLTEMGVA